MQPEVKLWLTVIKTALEDLSAAYGTTWEYFTSARVFLMPKARQGIRHLQWVLDTCDINPEKMKKRCEFVLGSKSTKWRMGWVRLRAEIDAFQSAKSKQLYLNRKREKGAGCAKKT